ncbi:CBF/NF-Y family transcription factor [Pochonia chlamydosporia 170]|uniref:DNA polymerase epsilon subunit D n=1 Tax=Pochonia chlamydosporia 170 TaxID=1380566 RepID=A0A179G4U1_METCM|nr:CBF/NF-Y family transcription factor [Pochonia chlamydosporia 170]OAQ72862.1 CBF/NF-Y family transcription factor [Pochonia chlamydosporia 170]
MPPRKSDQPRKSDAPLDEDSILAVPNESKASHPEKKDRDKDKDKEKDKDSTTIEDLTLPKSIITRLAKGVLPPNTQIQANAILAMSKSATVFINYLASHANENTMSAGKKTISPADVFKALDDVEFSFLKEPLEAEFAKFNQIQTEKRTNYRQKVRAKQDAGDDTDMADVSAVDSTIVSEGGAPRAKKARVEADAEGEGEEEDDAETEEEGDVRDEDDEDDAAGEEEEEGEEGEEEEGNASGDETQDALEEKVVREYGDEALDGDESD